MNKITRYKNIINKSKSVGEKPSSFDLFVKSLPKELEAYKGDNYRLKAAWKAYGEPKDANEAYLNGLIDFVGSTPLMPSIGYNKDTDTYEYLNSGEDNDTVAKDIRVWENDSIPFVQELKRGGYIRTFNEELNCWMYLKGGKTEEKIDSSLKGGEARNIVQLIEEAKKLNPRFIQRLSEPYKAILFDPKNEGKLYDGTHYMYADKDGLVFPTILEMEDKSLKYFENINEARERAIKNNNVLRFSPEEAVIFRDNYKQGWKKFFDEGEELQRTKAGWFKKDGKWFRSDGEDNQGKRYVDDEGGLWYFKQGGQMNVIPEGALHAHKNHMEGAGEDFTAKGIPVVDNEGNQTAEIEKEEIILNKENTEKIEDLYKKFYSEDISENEKDKLAILAGKRLAKELIENTDDRANLIEKVEEKG